ncbi:twin-arginine translocase TatA/TatE family subunit [Sulfurisphaera tokodaii]|uniref:Sec-independent protein translocase protein TatA n=2 Tax=Sulfurisphaera tokodaii TaxID=111955 RepID=Q96XA6_SULTO|nr:twin-arginine translocase TatA/TatE family subunit [Sulfurisphaera tokodaii]BAB67722.1 putative Sec-independent protein translocase protein TatA [Sulfurisphaera tokodaii str. 7]HII75241.1 twin-arginine translocase TatA/TatE family subunit [Sulfurisphaera tokodaii]
MIDMALTITDTAILLIVVILLFFGASKLPEVFRSLGRATGEFKKGQLEAELELAQMQQQLSQQNKSDELAKKIEELQKQIEELKKQQQQQQSK